MNKLKRALALLLCAAMLLGALSACGGEDPGTEESANPTGLVWSSSFSSLPGLGDDVNYITGAVYSGGSIYMSLQTHDPETFVSQNLFKKYDVASGEFSDLTGYVQAAVPEGADDGYNSMNAICAGPDGGLWVLENVGYTIYNLPEGFSGTEEEKWDYAEYGDNYYLRLLAPDGSEKLSIDLSPLAESQDFFYPQNMASDAEGNVYIIDQNNGFWVYGADGTQLYAAAPSPDGSGTLAGFSYVNNMIALGDGRVALMGYDDASSGNVLKPFDLAAKAFGESIEMPGNAHDLYPGDENYLFYYPNASNMYGFKADTGESVELFSLINCDIDESAIRVFASEGDGYICLTSSSGSGPNSDYSLELATVKQVEASSLPQKTTLKLASLYMGSDLRADILKFNRSSDKYRIEVTDYSEFNTEEDYSAGLTKLSTEIIAGHVPDILAVSGLPIEQYVARGLLEDLYPYLDADGEISRDDLFANVLSAMEIDGGLYQLTSSFTVRTLVGKASVVGSQPGWTVREMMDIYASQPQGTQLLSNTSAPLVLNEMLMMSMDSFVDWSNASCSFNSQDFIDLLEFANQFPAEYVYDENAPSEPTMIQSGQQMLYSMYMYDFTDIQFAEAVFGEDICVKGYPVPQGVGNVASISADGLAISASCADKDGAWSFVRQVLTEDYADNHWLTGFSINRAAYQKALEEAMTPRYYTDPETGEQVEASMGGMGYDDFTVDFYATTQDEADMIMDIIESVSGVMSYDESIMTIVSEEAAALFSGQKTAQQVADIIQNRASTYVAEQS